MDYFFWKKKCLLINFSIIDFGNYLFSLSFFSYYIYQWILSIFSILFSILFILIDFLSDKKRKLFAISLTDKFKFKDIFELPLIYWLLLILYIFQNSIRFFLEYLSMEFLKIH